MAPGARLSLGAESGGHECGRGTSPPCHLGIHTPRRGSGGRALGRTCGAARGGRGIETAGSGARGKPLPCAAGRRPARPRLQCVPSPAAVAKATAAEDSRAGLRPPANRTGARPSPDSLCSAAISGPGREAAPLRQKARAPEASGMVWDRVGGVRVCVAGAEGRKRPSELRPAAVPRGDRARLAGSPRTRRPGRLEPAGHGAVLSPTAAAPGALRDRDGTGTERVAPRGRAGGRP